MKIIKNREGYSAIRLEDVVVKEVERPEDVKNKKGEVVLDDAGNVKYPAGSIEQQISLVFKYKIKNEYNQPAERKLYQRIWNERLLDNNGATLKGKLYELLGLIDLSDEPTEDIDTSFDAEDELDLDFSDDDIDEIPEEDVTMPVVDNLPRYLKSIFKCKLGKNKKGYPMIEVKTLDLVKLVESESSTSPAVIK